MFVNERYDTRHARARDDLSNYFTIEPVEESAMQNDYCRCTQLRETIDDIRANGDKWEDR